LTSKIEQLNIKKYLTKSTTYFYSSFLHNRRSAIPMIVYVESNFVLELALLQAEHQSCQKILSLCELDNVHLVLPAISLTEPLETLVRRAKNRKSLVSQLEIEVKQLSRTALYSVQLDTLQEITALLLQSRQDEMLRLFGELDKIIKSC